MVLQHGAAAARWVPARADVGPSGRASRSGGTGLRHVCLLGARTRAGARAWVCMQAWQTMRAGRVGELVPARRQLVFSARAGLLAQWELLAARTRYPVSLPCDQHAHARELGVDRLVKADGGDSALENGPRGSGGVDRRRRADRAGEGGAGAGRPERRFGLLIMRTGPRPHAAAAAAAARGRDAAARVWLVRAGSPRTRRSPPSPLLTARCAEGCAARSCAVRWRRVAHSRTLRHVKARV